MAYRLITFYLTINIEKFHDQLQFINRIVNKISHDSGNLAFLIIQKRTSLSPPRPLLVSNLFPREQLTCNCPHCQLHVTVIYHLYTFPLFFSSHEPNVQLFCSKFVRFWVFFDVVVVVATFYIFIFFSRTIEPLLTNLAQIILGERTLKFI